MKYLDFQEMIKIFPAQNVFNQSLKNNSLLNFLIPNNIIERGRIIV